MSVNPFIESLQMPDWILGQERCVGAGSDVC